MADENNETVTEQPAPESAGNASPLGDVSALADELADTMPEPSPHAIAAEKEKESAKRAAWADYRDAAGNPFDPDLHVTDSEGAPVLTKTGKLRRRPGRKSADSKKPGGRVGGLSVPDDSARRLREQARANGIAAAQATFTLGVAIGGTEWAPMRDDERGIDERAYMESAYAEYFEAKGLQDIPPGVALTIALTSYAAQRFTMPKTQTRMQRAKEWIAKKIAARKVRKKDNGARSDTGDNGKRKDDTSEKASG